MDKDLFEDSSEEATANEFEQSSSSNNDPYSNILDELIQKEGLSPQEAEEMKRLMQHMVPNEPTMVLSGFFTFDAQNQNFRTNASMHRAMMHVLDELSDGRVIKLWRIFDIEQQAIRTHASLTSAKKVYNDNVEKQSSEAKMNALEFVLEVINMRMEKLHQQYNMALEEVDDYEPDYSVFETGKKNKDTKSWVNKIIFWRKNNA